MSSSLSSSKRKRRDGHASVDASKESSRHLKKGKAEANSYSAAPTFRKNCEEFPETTKVLLPCFGHSIDVVSHILSFLDGKPKHVYYKFELYDDCTSMNLALMDVVPTRVYVPTDVKPPSHSLEEKDGPFTINKQFGYLKVRDHMSDIPRDLLRTMCSQSCRYRLSCLHNCEDVEETVKERYSEYKLFTDPMVDILGVKLHKSKDSEHTYTMRIRIKMDVACDLAELSPIEVLDNSWDMALKFIIMAPLMYTYYKSVSMYRKVYLE